jgi:ATP-binding cassette, subfamily B, bacterial
MLSATRSKVGIFMAAEFVARSFDKSNYSSPLRFIWSHIARHPLFALMMVIGAFSNAALATAVPYYVGVAFNSLLKGEGMATVVAMAWAIVGSQLLRGGLQLMRNASAEVFAQRIERDVRDELYASLLAKSMTFHDMQPVGEIMARVTNDVREMNLMMNPGMNLIIGSGMFLLAPLIAAPRIYPAFILVPALFTIAYIWAQYRYIRQLHPIAQEVRASFGQMNARVAETLEGLQVVKGTAQENREQEIFNDNADAVRDYFIQQGYIEARYLPLLLFGLATVGALIHSIYLYRLGLVDTGQIVGFTGQVLLFGFPVFSSQSSLSQVALGYASAQRILNIITTETDLDRNEQGHDQAMQGAVQFEHVNFGYTDGKPVLRDVSFSIQPGKTVAVVGQTGSGKSTVAKLINRIYDIDSGRVLIDGIDVRDWRLGALRRQISIIEQDIFLFSRSIADNIRFGRPDATDEEVEVAARKAQAHEFIIGFPEGYQTIIGQRGVTLSGGQRQRIAIARAFLTDPRILILDDSTSAIDSATEDRIQQAIWAAAQGRTTILITHRLSQIRWADHIVVLRQGKVAAQGKHEDLLRDSESYRRIFARYEGTPVVAAERK